jgi:hypothetical protein
MEKQTKLYGQVYEADDLFDLSLLNFSLNLTNILHGHWKKLKVPASVRVFYNTLYWI